MSRCGHAGQCNCVLVDGQGTRFTGIGTPAQPGAYNVRLSSESGNALRFDGQGALYAPYGEGGASGCGVSVEGLPQERLVIGRGGAGRLLAPDHTMTSMTRAIDLSLRAVHVRCRPLSDGTPVAFPALSVRNQSGSFPQLEHWPAMPNNHADYLIPNMDLAAYKRMPIFAGWERELQIDRQTTTYEVGGGAPPVTFNEENLGGRWGFFGFGARFGYGGLTLSEVLSALALRTVVQIEMASATPVFLELVLAMIRRHCAQEAVIVSSTDLDELDMFAQENIATMAWIDSAETAAANPPQQVVDRGVRWVNIIKDLPDSTIASYTEQGLNVVVGTLTRHHHWNRLDALGARGALSDDPVYMMGADDPTFHRVASGHTSLRHHSVYPGQLTYNTDQGAYYPPWSRGEKLMGWGPDDTSTRGVALLPPRAASDAQQWISSTAPLNERRMHGYGLLIPRTVNTENLTSSGVTDILTGWLNPLPDQANYAIEYQTAFCTSPNQGGRNVGMFFGLPDDRSLEEHREAGSEYWQTTLQWNGQMHLRRYQGAEIVEGETTTVPDTMQVGAWFRFRVIVDDVSIRFQRITFAGNITAELTMNGVAHGPYTSLFKNELGGDGQLYLFTAGFRQLWIQSPFPGGAPSPLNPDGSYPWELGGEEGEDDDSGVRGAPAARATTRGALSEPRKLSEGLG